MIRDDHRCHSTATEDEALADVLGQLVELRQAVAQTLGRDQYLYGVVDRAVESRHLPRAQAALVEFGMQPGEVRERIELALTRS